MPSLFALAYTLLSMVKSFSDRTQIDCKYLIYSGLICIFSDFICFQKHFRENKDEIWPTVWLWLSDLKWSNFKFPNVRAREAANQP